VSEKHIQNVVSEASDHGDTRGVGGEWEDNIKMDLEE
jgi:hypothetical protein